MTSENERAKHPVIVQLRDIIRKLEDPGVQLLDVSGRVDYGVVPIPHHDVDQFRREGHNGEAEYTLRIRLYNPAKNALNHLDDPVSASHPQATDLTGD